MDVTLHLPDLCDPGDWQEREPTPVDAVEHFIATVQGSGDNYAYRVEHRGIVYLVDMADGGKVTTLGDNRDLEPDQVGAFARMIEANAGSRLDDEDLYTLALACLRELQWRLPLDGVRQGDLHTGYSQAATARRSIATTLAENKGEMFTIYPDPED